MNKIKYPYQKIWVVFKNIHKINIDVLKILGVLQNKRK